MRDLQAERRNERLVFGTEAAVRALGERSRAACANAAAIAVGLDAAAQTVHEPMLATGAPGLVP